MPVLGDVNVDEFAQKHGLNRHQTLTLKGLWVGFTIASVAKEVDPDGVEEDEAWQRQAISNADKTTLTAYEDMLSTLLGKLEEDA